MNWNFDQKQTLKCALKAGECLIKIKELCAIENKKFIPFLKEFNINWDKSYVYFLISFYNFTKEYPKLSNLSLSPHFVMKNFKKIKLAIWSSNEEREYWRSI
jgi:restriction endonuclease S subunit